MDNTQNREGWTDEDWERYYASFEQYSDNDEDYYSDGDDEGDEHDAHIPRDQNDFTVDWFAEPDLDFIMAQPCEFCGGGGDLTRYEKHPDAPKECICHLRSDSGYDRNPYYNGSRAVDVAWVLNY